MEKTDSLSKRLDWEVEIKRDNKNEILMKLEQLEVRKTKKVEIIIEGVDLLEEVRQSKVKDNEIMRAVKKMKQAGVKMLRDKEQREVDSIMYKKERIYVPKDNRLRVEIIRLHYDIPVGGHRRQQKMVELVIHNF